MVSTWVTRCPQCGTSFRLTKSQLNAANGSVRCGSCMHVFLATNYLIPDNQTTLAGYSEKSSSPNTRFDQGLQSSFDVEDDLLEFTEPSTTQAEEATPPDASPASSPTLGEDSFQEVDESWALALLAELEQEEELEEARVKKSQEKNNIRPNYSPSPQIKPIETEEKASSPTPFIATPKVQPTSQPVVEAEEPPVKQEKSDSKSEAAADPQRQAIKPLPVQVSSIQPIEAQQQAEDQPSSTRVGDNSSAVASERATDSEQINQHSASPKPIPSSALKATEVNSQVQAKSNLSEGQTADGTSSAATLKWVSTFSKKTSAQTENKHDIVEQTLDEPITSTPTAEPKEKAARPAPPPAKQTKPVKRTKTLLPDEEDEPVIEDIEQPAATETDAENSFLLNELASDPLELVLPEKRNWWKITAWMVANIILVAGLIIQYGWFKFDTLAQDERYRPYYTKACQYVGCKLPTRIDINKIKGNELLVRSHPRYPNALLIDAIIFNQANFAQPFPTIKLTFSDINDNVIASRGFKPSDYLAGELAGSKEMPARVPIHLSFEIVDPGPNAVNYHMTFLKHK
ncbi:DUF3426 domain-containing protein [Zooshikella ganghwensis]|uniref:DUF3426 domain-containing protein n=1 Tax=Zooshikella ganghwensis TaxID=202772 RepID=A0A4P9VJW4_9GAMM|nr:DUF3426 domain-containing protein [Zooshikella ganghwensis]RDH42527.1 DUF3426 domain-containing protein [Zooshikella ganghwensis]